MFGSTMVPAGTYTLFTHLVENGNWELVINKQTGQWGTAYDAKQDLVRVPMTVTSNNPVTEQMTITVTQWHECRYADRCVGYIQGHRELHGALTALPARRTFGELM